MKKKFVAFAALFALILTLCSCMSTEYGIVIREDGTARAYAEMAIQKSALTAMSMSEDDFFEQVDESDDSDGFEGWEREKFSKTIDGDEYTGVRYYNDSSLDFLAEEGLSSFSDDDDGEMSFRREGGDLVVHIVYQNDDGDEPGDLESYAEQEMLTAKFRVSAPFEIVETNGVIDEDGSVYWDMTGFLMGESGVLDMEVRYHVGADLGLILWIVGGVLLAAILIVVIVLVVRKRPKPLDPAAMSASYHAEANIASPDSDPLPDGKAAGTPADTAPAETPEAGDPEAQTPAANAAPRFCSDCGAKLKADDTFCSNCGARVK
ncbi:MAG: zinc ribbon domain-containing protein [Bacteroides sp.]|nr:zinc ribbon domain-containing protein [Eubacterium sp.]MCM1419550.1 zinc ribbon domain-containing protein [Roseburia sp.]MCM1461499.1 zinc ribbon domain-containing protein [Bacteroides sp.]